MADPFTMPNPWLAAMRPRPRVAPALPEVSPEEQDSTLGSLMETSLGGLSYVGKLADKTFGGRAVRGLLGGNPRELASILPFSDTIGLTDERETVQGTDLLANAGLTTRGDDSIGNLAAGFGAEVLLDPSTYLGFGALTKAGGLAAKAGALPKGLAPRLRGFDVAESAVRPTLQPGQELADVVGVGKSVLPETLERSARAAGTPVGLNEPLAGLFGIGLPFMPPVATFGTGATAQRIAGRLDRLGEAALATAPIRAVRAALDPNVGGAYTREAQLLSEEVLRPLMKQADVGVREQYIDFLQRADPLLSKARDAGDERSVADAVRMAAEFDPAKAADPVTGRTMLDEGRRRLVNSPAGFTPAEADAVLQLGQDLGAAAREFLPKEQELGLGTKEYLDAFTGYLARQKASLPRQKGEGLAAYFSRLSKEFNTTHGSMIQRQDMFRDIPGGTTRINELAKDQTLRAMPDLQRREELRLVLTGSRTPIGNKAAYKQAEQLSKWIGSLPEAYSKDGLDFFKPDPFADFLLRGTRSATATASAQTVLDGVKRFGAPVQDLITRGETDFVPVSELLKQLGMAAQPSPGVQPGMLKAAERLAAKTGTPINPNDLKDFAVPGDIARDMVKLGKAWSTPRELGPVAVAWDMASNLFKSWATVPFPAFHARNFMSGLFNTWRDDALSPGAMKEAWNVIRGGGLDAPLPGMAARTGQEAVPELIREAAARRVAFTRDASRGADTATPGVPGGLVARAPKPPGSGGSLAGDLAAGAWGLVPKSREQLNPFAVEGVAREADANSLVGGMRKMQGTLDDWVQLGHYIAKRRQGFTPDAAAEAVKKYHLDYTALTSTERNVMKRVFPWYSFSRRSLPTVLSDLATKPGKVAGSLRAVSGVRDPFEFVPSYIAEGASVPIPGAPDGQQRYVSSFGLPVEDEAVKTLGSLAQGDVTRSLQQLLGMSQPLLKLPMEQAFGTQLYSGRRLEDLKPLQATALTPLNEEQSRGLSQVIANTPASRFFTTADKFLDERKGLGTTLLNTLTGVRVSDVDAERQRDIAAKNLLREELRGTPGARVAENLYVPKEQLPLLDPQQRELYLIYRAAADRVRQRAAEEAKAGR